MKQSLIAFDTDRIKDYIFATEELKEIRGASNILDRLNRKDMPKLVEGDCYYAFGGGGLFVTKTEKADDAITRVEKAYADQTGGAATITGVQLPLPEGFDIDHDDIRPHWKHLGYKLRAAKSRNPTFLTSVSHPLFHFGLTDGAFYASHQDEDQELISTPSHLKRDRNFELRHTTELPNDFSDIALSNGFMALIYADGDRLGEVLEACKTLPDIHMVAQTLYEIMTDVKQRAFGRQLLAEYQYDTLLQGGDDLILAVPANNAFEIALYLTEAFREEAARRLPKTLTKSRPHTISTAIVWAHVNFPFRAWLNIAESVLKFAKMDGAKRNLTGLVNFMVITSANHLEFKELYHHVLTTEDAQAREIIRTLRAYTTEDLRKLQHYRRALRQMSRSKLEALSQATFLPLSLATFQAVRVFTHWRDTAVRKALIQMVDDLVSPRMNASRVDKPGVLKFPFFEVTRNDKELGHEVQAYYTPLYDLAELWDFMPGV